MYSNNIILYTATIGTIWEMIQCNMQGSLIIASSSCFITAAGKSLTHCQPCHGAYIGGGRCRGGGGGLYYQSISRRGGVQLY